MLVRAVKMEVLVVVDIHVMAEDLAHDVMEAVDACIKLRRIEIEVIEDHESYMETKEVTA